MNKWKRQKLYNRAWQQFGVFVQIFVAMEECSELIKELSKAIRGKVNSLHIAEEVADVEIMLEQLKQLFGLQAVVEGFKEDKIRRLEERLNEEAKNAR